MRSRDYPPVARTQRLEVFLHLEPFPFVVTVCPTKNRIPNEMASVNANCIIAVKNGLELGAMA
jgi:hypothetical protein